MKLPTIYSRATTGKIKQWSIGVLQMGDGSCYIETEHGYLTGKKQVDSRYVGEGKNIGKANETTPYEQACSEAESAFKRKQDDGYVVDINNIPSEDSGNFLPMLAHRFDKHSSKISYPAYTQRKLDGSRCLAKKENGTVTMWSRKGKPITIPNKIIDELTEILNEGESVDGELYVHGWTFQRLIAATKKHRPDTDLLEYHIYDSPHLTKTFEDRFINSFTSERETQRVKIVPTPLVNNLEELNAEEQSSIESGYEGLMVRNTGSLYKYKNRSYDLQKVKRFQDSEYKIIGGKDGEGREAGLIIFNCITKDGIEFSVRPKGSHEERSKMFKELDSYIGKELTVQYFELTDDGVPRFPVGIAVRDYE